MNSVSCPDKWVIVEIHNEKYGTFRKLLTSWYGGYVGSNSWRMSSSIVEMKFKNSVIEIVTSTGSIYICNQNNYGMNLTASNQFAFLEQRAKSENFTIKVIEQKDIKGFTNDQARN